MTQTSTATTVLEALESGLPDGAVRVDADVVAAYSMDRATYCPVGKALALVHARSTADVQHVMRVASKHRVPVVPQGARSGLSGAANATDGCILLNLEKMDQVLEIDAPNRLVVTQPGIFNATLSRAVQAEGLFYPPDPSSWEFCSIGGDVSTNSGGLCCVKYGVTTDCVLGLEVVLADGQVLRTGRRTVKAVAGYDLVRLFVGSEGTLGVITEITLMLRPETEAPLTVAAVYDSARTVAEAVSQVVRCGVTPSLLEFMDRVTVQAVNEAFHMGIAPETGAFGAGTVGCGRRQDGAGAGVRGGDRDRGGRRCRRGRAAAGWSPPGADGDGEARHDDDRRRVRAAHHELAEFVERVEQVSAECGLTIGVVGHAGDGNFHPTVVFDGQDPEQVALAKQAFDDIMQISLDLGGTITGEHGVGVLKMELLEQEIGPLALAVHRRIKASLDPLGILNPGKVFELSADLSNWR